MEQDYRLAEGEYRFACLVWDNEPLPSGQLVTLAAGQTFRRRAGLEKKHHLYRAEKAV